MSDGIDLVHRNKHDSLEIVKIKTGIGGRTTKGCIRVSSDARLVEMLEGLMLDAAYHQIYNAYTAIAGGQMARSMDHSRAKGESRSDEGNAGLLMAQYFTWAQAVQKARLSHAMCMDVIAFGNSLRQVDKDRRQPRGRAKINLVECLKLWS